MSNRTLLPAAVLLFAVSTAACSAGATPSVTPAASPGGTPGASPTAAPTPTPAIVGIAHPTGAKDIVLRFDSSGGFVPPEFLAARVPFFTLYGDGRIVFVRSSAPVAEGDVAIQQPLRTAVLSEEQIQALLESALGEGGLAIAREDYSNMVVSDAPTSVFTINADDDTKTVSVYALGFDQQPGPDSQVLAQLTKLGERLRDFDQGGTIASDPYDAAAYRGVLTDAAGVQGVPVHGWPWADIQPSDFAFPNDPNVLQQATAVLTKAQVEQLGIEGYQNGIAGGLYVRGEDGKPYSLVIRPLLPDESQ